MDYVNDFLARHPGPVRTPLRTKRGDALSVQASAGHYCSPKEDNAPSYSHVEIWWQNRCPRPLRRYATRHNEPAAWVPVEALNAWVAGRGGLAN